MLVVKDLAGTTEALTDVKGVEINEEVNGDFSISFTALATRMNEHSYPLLKEESIVELDGHEFRVKKMDEIRNRKTVNAPHTFFDLIENQVYDINGGTKTVGEFFSIALSGTGWTFENVDVDGHYFIPNFGQDNTIALIRLICEVAECEIKIEPNKHLKIYKEIGEDNDEQFRYKHNIKTLRKSVDTSKLATVIKGYGGNGLEVTYTSPNVSIYGERHAEPVRDEEFTVSESLIERIKRELVDVPEVSIQLDITHLGFNADLGDKVWTIYEPMDIEFQQRVMAIKYYPFSKRAPVVTLSNKKKTFSDLLTETKIEIKENQKQTQSRIEQTNDRITFEVETIGESLSSINQTSEAIKLRVEKVEGDVVEAYSQIELTATEIRSEVSAQVETLDGKIAENASSITQTAEAIRSEVSGVKTEVMTHADNQASAAETNAKDYTDGEIGPIVTRVSSAESSITQLSNSIESKVSEDIYLIDKSVLEDDISGLGTRVSSAESTITQQAGQISSRVTYSDYNGNEIASRINQTATTITLDASRINLTGITNVAQQLQLGSSPSVGGTKRITFNGQNQINDSGQTMTVTSTDLVLWGDYGVMIRSGGNLDLSNVNGITWGSNAPSTTAKFG